MKKKKPSNKRKVGSRDGRRGAGTQAVSSPKGKPSGVGGPGGGDNEFSWRLFWSHL